MNILTWSHRTSHQSYLVVGAHPTAENHCISSYPWSGLDPYFFHNVVVIIGAVIAT